MNSCELVTYVSSIACIISESCSEQDVAVMATIFTQLGDSLATILAHQNACAQRSACEQKTRTE